MTLAMTAVEREEFLSGVHVGVLAVARDGEAPLAVPVWYSYRPGGEVTVITDGSSLKAALIQKAGCFSLCAQSETAPYRHVSVEGSVTRIDRPADSAERAAMAHRYLGAELGDAYIEATTETADALVAVRMLPQRWRSIDYAKQFPPPPSATAHDVR